MFTGDAAAAAGRLSSASAAAAAPTRPNEWLLIESSNPKVAGFDEQAEIYADLLYEVATAGQERTLALVGAHRFLGERFGLDQQAFVGFAAGRHRFAPDDDHQRHRHRRDPLGLDMDHGRRAGRPAGRGGKLGHLAARIVQAARSRRCSGIAARKKKKDDV